MSDVYVGIFAAAILCVGLLYELREIRRALNAVVEELDHVRRIFIDARDSLEKIAESVKTPEEKAAYAQYVQDLRLRQEKKAE